MPSIEKIFENILTNGGKEKVEIDDDPEYTKVIGNEVHFYGEITPENTLEFVEAFRTLEVRLLKQKADLIGYEPEIRVHIMSEGGDMFSGLTLKNILETTRKARACDPRGSCRARDRPLTFREGVVVAKAAILN